MAKDPAERYQTATELADAARAALTNSFGAAPPPPGPTEHAMWPSAQPGTIAAPAYAGSLAPPSVPVRIGRYLLMFLILVVSGYLVITLVAGHHRAQPGIDQLGGTRITLTARTSDGSPPTPGALSASTAHHQRPGQGAGDLGCTGRHRGRQHRRDGARQ